MTDLHTAAMKQELPFGVGGGLVAIKTLLSRDPCVHANVAIEMIDAILAEQPAQQEPVAWRVNVTGYANNYFNAGKPRQQDIDYWRNQGVEIEYAYTRTQAREPLTDEQVAYILGQLPKPPTNDGGALHDWAMQAVRALAAHSKGDT